MNNQTQRVDRDGVLSLIQKMRYLYSSMTIEVELFTGKIIRIPEEYAGNCMDLTQERPTRMQWLQIEQALNERILANWSEL